jgi:response regulator RpfG family c-di-GMP phosphodiesterase
MSPPADGQCHEADDSALDRLAHRRSLELEALNADLSGRLARCTLELESAKDRLKHSYLTSIKALTALIELRGSAHIAHARRVADLARRIAQAMTLEAHLENDLVIAALLHDVGHIGLSDTVLARPLSRLDQEELQRYRLHSALGEQAVLASEDMQGVAPLVRSHHERWDGQGFPDGLYGAAIPSGARILAVADAFEDLQSGRIDGRAVSRSDAHSAILAGRGSRFDPSVVEAFESVISIADATSFVSAASAVIPAMPTVRLRTAELRAGQTLMQDFVSPEGRLLLSAGRQLDDDLICRIRAFERKHGLALTLAVKSPWKASPTAQRLNL